MIILRTVKNFSSLNIAASILLFLMAILAAVIANSPMAPLYQGFLLQELHLRICASETSTCSPMAVIH